MIDSDDVEFTRVTFSSNVSWSIYNFRRDLIGDLMQSSWSVYTVAQHDDYSTRLSEIGCEHQSMDIRNNSSNPLQDLFLLMKYIKVYRSIKPKVILHNAIKPNIFGTLAAGVLGIPVINNVSGLGTLFIKRSMSTRIAIWLYRISQRFATHVFFQNSDDQEMFIDLGIITERRSSILPGSGVDTTRFGRSVGGNHQNNLESHFLFVGRLLYQKGFRELIEAARIVKQQYPNVIIGVVGEPYEDNVSSLSMSEISGFVDEGLIKYHGSSDDVRPYYEGAQCVVLPSYREGRSKVLLEACSMGVPIITTDVPGCRDVVIDGYNGFLCQVQDAQDLAEKMLIFLALERGDQIEMGKHGRKRAEEEFDVKIVNRLYLQKIREVLKEHV